MIELGWLVIAGFGLNFLLIVYVCGDLKKRLRRIENRLEVEDEFIPLFNTVLERER